MRSGIGAVLMTVALVALGLVGFALWRSARSDTGIWWPLVVAGLVVGGLCLAAIRLDQT